MIGEYSSQCSGGACRSCSRCDTNYAPNNSYDSFQTYSQNRGEYLN